MPPGSADGIIAAAPASESASGRSVFDRTDSRHDRLEITGRSVYRHDRCTAPRSNFRNKKHLKNVGPIRHCEPPHAALPFTRCHRLRIDVHNNNDDDDDDDNDNA